MVKKRMHILLFGLAALLVFCYFSSIVGTSKAKFTTEKSIKNFTISTTKQIQE